MSYKKINSRKSLPHISLAIVMILGSFFLIGNAILETINIQLNLSFQQRLAIIGPYLTDKEEKTLRSKWASMTNVSGYNEVNKELADMAERYNINLPKPF